MSPSISPFANSIAGSAVVDFRRRADALEAKGISIVDFGIGEPDFESPPPVKEALIRAIRDGLDKYVDPRGLVALREAISAFEHDAHGLKIDPDNIVVTTGSTGSLSLASRALFSPGYEVLLIEPCYGPYRSLVAATGATPIGVSMPQRQGRFVVEREPLDQMTSTKTKAIIVNNPCNPTGRVLTQTELEIIAEFAEENDIWILSDEVYSELVYGNARHLSITSLSADTAARTVTLNSVSKTFAMTGWRIGYCLASSTLAPVLARINHLTTRCAVSFAQHASVTAFRDCASHVEMMRIEYSRRRDAMIAGFQRIEGFECKPPDGTFYVFPKFPKIWGGSRALADYLLETAGLIVTPGAAYGPASDQNIRLSFATSMGVIETGLQRLKKALNDAGFTPEISL